MARSMDTSKPDPANVIQPGSRQSSPVSLVLIPLVIVLIWLLENFLLAGTTHLFQHANPLVLVLYTVLAGILVGIVVPVVRIRATFLSGAVNMFQIGFRSARRTIIAVGFTAITCVIVSLFTGLPGSGPETTESVALFFLMLPVTVAAVMICWGLVGTHIQAYVRREGITVSVIAGVIVTSVIFALALSALFAGPDLKTFISAFFGVGCISALFFFAVRDIYATVIVVTFCLSTALSSLIDPAYLVPLSPVGISCGSAVVLSLVAVHWYFARHYTTILLPQQ
ncbi:hypothetical protein Mboo_2089 [Methanoregula boonei 6A8]|uniref:Uncharacterized protein n=2 Tax=Methanoregula TaxID=395331 RepID=A7IA42_METB6|nr:hypothetical protein Mboo_2089 [Methanoregula boonei 6A8]